jgi:hypothetical protein
MFIDAPSFVIQRRIQYPLPDVHRGLADRTPLYTTEQLELALGGFLHIDGAFRPMAPYSARQPMPTWCARATLSNDRRRVVAVVELEISMWSYDSSELQLRPAARNPDRWSARRARSYFGLAHPATDEIARRVAQRAVNPPPRRMEPQFTSQEAADSAAVSARR